MGSFSDTPALLAGGDIYPYRFVKVSTAADDTGLQATASTETILGVSDASTNGFNSDYHAQSGQPITLQGGNIVLVIAAGNITRGAFVQADSNGKAVTAVTTAASKAFQGYVALQSATAGLIIRCYRVGSFVTYPA